MSPNELNHCANNHSDKLNPNMPCPSELYSLYNLGRKRCMNLPLSISNFYARKFNLTANNIYSFNNIDTFEQFLENVDQYIDQAVSEEDIRTHLDYAAEVARLKEEIFKSN